MQQSEIRKLTEADFPGFAHIAIQAFPANKENTLEYKEKLAGNLLRTQQKSGNIEFYGLFREGKLLGGMRLHSFELNLFGKIVPAGGVGLVAVDLLHKKEKVAKELIEFFIRHFKEKGMSVTLLYPFSPGFYKKMGYGYGTKMNQYQIKPGSFPGADSKEGLTMLTETDGNAIRECYNRFAKKTHGMILKTAYDIEKIFENPENRVAGFFSGSELKGYIVFGFEQVDKKNFLRNHLVVRELIYETPKALSGLAVFLNTQADQIERVIFNTQDDALEYMLGDPANSSNHLIPSVFHETNTSGVGLMYRVSLPENISTHFSGRHFNHVSTCFTMRIHDSFLLEEPSFVCLKLEDGMLGEGKEEEAEFEIELDGSDMSSLLMGAVNARKLYQFGRMKVSDPSYLGLIEKAFQTDPKPVCMTPF
ncbi:GNAT family N-acetyltransferase [Neobacillus notoginsengisoli]|uniref:GNAT family N-acetyltransferase n=1 Tax=Neobacillus notoginsengisoli TaxID=1578198 RepID=A0A417YPS2_9BACI|nr:GNAT family N-acetyltransferase [Neobacillus notoginsengisoli]RHW35679.1 GNAT family N-acetyltransferase [Neobacillus notoginsengisoli]